MNTWLLTLFAAAIGYYNGYNNAAHTAFFLSFASMQFIEYLLWSFPKWNAAISAAGLGVIGLQPLFSILQVTNPAHLMALLAGYVVYATHGAYMLFNAKEYDITMKSVVAPNGHLKWLWLPENTFSTVMYMVLLFTPLMLQGYWIALAGGLAALAVSLWAYHKDGTWGSMWCWFAALFSFWIIGAGFWKSGSCSLPT
jgi:hypothetical protein